MNKLKEKIAKIYFLNQSKELEQAMQGAAPHTVVVATLKHRLFLERCFFAFIVLGIFSFLMVEIFQNRSLMKKLYLKESYLVPSNISNIMRVRANSLSDDQIFEFAEDYINNFTNLNYDDVDIRIRYLTRYMHPTLKARFKAEMSTRIPFWKANKIDQSFTFGHVESVKRVNETFSFKNEKGEKVEKTQTFFKVSIWGTLRKYVDGSLTDPYKERIFMKFTTTPIKQDTSWVFEVWEIERKTFEEIEQEKIAKKEMEVKGAKY